MIDQAEPGAALFVLREYGLKGAGAFGRLVVLEFLAEQPKRQASAWEILAGCKARRLFKKKRLEREVEVLRRAGLVAKEKTQVILTERGEALLKQLK